MFLQNSSLNFRLLLLLVILHSCSTREPNPNIFIQANQSLNGSSASLYAVNTDILQTLVLKKADPTTKRVAEKWFPKAMAVEILSKKFIDFIDSLKTALANQTTIVGDPVSKVFIEEKQNEALFNRAKHYKSGLQNVDTTLWSELGPFLIIFSKEHDSSRDINRFTKTYFGSATVQEATVLLNSIRNTVLTVENKCLRFCLNQIGHLDGDNFQSFEALVGQNAQILQIGNHLEITAGLGSFSKNNLDGITINGKSMMINERGFTVYKMKTKGKAGHYAVPVVISYRNEDSVKQQANFSVQYTLIDAIKK